MKTISPDMTFEQIHDALEFTGAADWLVPVKGDAAGQMAQMPLSFTAQLGWSPEAMAEGFQYIGGLSEAGKTICYPLYTEDELAEDPSAAQRYLVHFSVEKKARFVITCSGGAYIGAASMIEGFPTCKEINDLGYHAFTLNYRALKDAKAPNPINDLAAAVRFVIEHAGELNVDTSDYAIGGFSAGGHLVGCFGTESIGWKHYGLPRPAAVMLAYPVITMKEYTHEDSRKNFLQEYAEDMEMREKYSVEAQITAAYPAAYVWQCDKDSTVPIQNTQLLVSALNKYGVKNEYHTFDSEQHGWGCGKGTPAEGWVKQAVALWETQFEIEVLDELHINDEGGKLIAQNIDIFKIIG